MSERVELHLKYRPKTFDELIGNELVKESLMSVLERTRTFIFYGPRGCGKTTIARLIAGLLKIDDINIAEIDAADKTGVDDARAIKEAAQYRPLSGKYKIFIIDEVHRLSGNAMDSLLKTLENPPEFCYFVLCTTELAKVSQTIKSRAKSYAVEPLDDKQARRLIRWVCTEEGFRVDAAIIDEIVMCCEGIPREIIIALDMVRDIQNIEEAKTLIKNYVRHEVRELCQALLVRAPWKTVRVLLSGIKEDPERVRMMVLGYMDALLMKDTNDNAALVLEYFKDSVIYSGHAGLTYACYMICK